MVVCKLVIFTHLTVGAVYLVSNYGNLFGSKKSVAPPLLAGVINGVATALEKLMESRTKIAEAPRHRALQALASCQGP